MTMINDNWNGLMKVLEIEHLSQTGIVLYREENIRNMLHKNGEEYVLRTLFIGQSTPANYYLGLDYRTTLEADNEIDDVNLSEPSVNAYERQPVGSDQFVLVTNLLGNTQANSPIVTFRAIGGSWGPVKNIFLTTSNNTSGYLISSAALSAPVTVADGEIVSMRLGFALKDCATV